MIPNNFPGKNPITGINIGKPDTPSGKAKGHQTMVSAGSGVKKPADAAAGNRGNIKSTAMPKMTMPGVKKRIR